jgi:outer membrane protein insertion porin family
MTSIFRKSFSSFLALLLLCSIGWAQKGVIGSVEVVGNTSADKNLILSVAGLHSGESIDFEKIQNAIKAIYGLRLFSDVQIWGEEQVDKINLTVKVTEYPRIRQILIEGNDKIKKDDILEVLTIKEGEIASPSQVQDGLNKILDLYHQKKFPLAQVETDPISHSSGDLVLKYTVKEGPKVKLKNVLITGNRAFKSSKLKGKLKLKVDNFEEKFQEGKENLISFYKDNGYVDATIVAESVWYSPDKKLMNVWLAVSEGPRYHFGNVSVEGEKLFSEGTLLRRMKFKAGEVYSQKKYEESLQALSELYFEEGHIYLQVRDEVKTDQQKVNIHLSLVEGLPAHVNLINVEGNTKTKEKVIRRELFLKPGDLFRRSLLMRSIRNVMVLNYFANVTPNFEVLPNGDVDLVLKIEEKPTGQISFGAGYSERDKLVGTIALGIPNLFGNGQNVDFNWDFGKRRNSFSLSYTDPWFRDTPTTFGFDIFSIDRRGYSNEYTEKSRGFGLRAGKRLTWPDNYFRVVGRYRIERINYDDFSDVFIARLQLADSLNWEERLEDLKDPQITSAIDFTIVRDSRDLIQFATRGSVASANTEIGGSFIGGDWNYIKETIDLRKYIKVIGKLVLYGRAKFGIVDSWKDDIESNISFTERFTPGGIDPDGLVRGYPDSWIGPRSRDGFPLARSMAVYNLELQIPIAEQQIYVILFTDAGNAWLTGKEAQLVSFSGGLYRSVGFGVRLVVPMLGMIGFDYGYGFDYPFSDKGRIHFQFGQQF